MKKTFPFAVCFLFLVACGRTNVETPFEAGQAEDSEENVDNLLKNPGTDDSGAAHGGAGGSGTQSSGSGTGLPTPASTVDCYWEDAHGYVSYPGEIRNTFVDELGNRVAEGGGCVYQSFQKVWDALKQPVVLQWNDTKPDGHSLIDGIEAPFVYGVLVGYKNTPLPFITVKWQIAWKHQVLSSRGQIDDIVEVQYQKVWGEETLEHWSGRIYLIPLNATTTSFSMTNMIRGKAGTPAEGKIDMPKSIGAVSTILRNLRDHAGHQ